VQVFSFKNAPSSFRRGMATKNENRIIVNLSPALAVLVKRHADTANRSNSNFIKGLIKEWMKTAPRLEPTDEEKNLPPVAGEKAVVLTSAGAGKMVGLSAIISNTPSDTPDTSKSDAALTDSVSRRVKALKPLADRIRNSHTERK
jgi:hypothetical protein